MKYKKIVDDNQYGLYSEVHEKLTFKDYKGNKDEIELIEILIDEYESRTVKLDFKMNPIEVLEYLLEVNEITKSQLAREIEVSRQLISDVLSYRRDLSKSMILKLSRRFKLNTSIFTKEYKLKTKSSSRKRAAV